MITENITRDVADAHVSDDCRVEVYVADLRKHRSALLTASQARELAARLIRAAAEAEDAAEEMRHEYQPLACELTPPISPDCASGKCAACIGTAWDMDRDELTNCGHDCHAGGSA